MPSPLRTISRSFLAGAIFLAGISANASVQEVRREILGIHLKLTKDEVLQRLNEIGSFARGERKGQEVWKVKDASFSHLIVAFDKNGKLRFVTAVARDDAEAKRVPYQEIGNLEKARQAGDANIKNFNYQWDLPSQDGSPRILVSARGRDPTFLETWSLKVFDGQDD